METKQVKCIICERKFPRRLKIRSGRKRTGAKALKERGKNTITCSTKCAKIYRRVYWRVQQNYKRKVK